jgi:hypothetical protein
VVCRQLGFPLGAESVQTDSYYGEVLEDFSYDEVQCSGSETELNECPHDNQNDCKSFEGAGVVCRSESKPNGTKFYQAYQIIIVKVEIIQ